MKGIASLLLMLAVILPVSGAHAHEAHRKDMSDSEIAAMKQAAENAPDEAMEMSDKGADLPDPADTVIASDGHNAMADHDEATPFSLTDLLGRLHPALVHFPIALFLTAGLAELLLLARPASGLEPTVRFLVYVGAAGGLLAALMGWLAAGIRLSDRSETLGLHRWTGTGIALAGVVAAIVAYRASQGRMLIRLILAGMAIALLFQGYWGAEMSLGPNHMGM
jgi:uncharacterized membrane protein